MSMRSYKGQAPVEHGADARWAIAYRILVAEDNEINQELIQMLLEEIGLSADIARDGKEALLALQQSAASQPYHLVLMDCQMPNMDGFEATQKIRAGEVGELLKDVVILAVTANALPGDKQRCLDAGMNDYISKPIDETLLLKKLQDWLPRPEHGESNTVAASTGVSDHGGRSVNKHDEHQRIPQRAYSQSESSQSLVIPNGLKVLSIVPSLANKPAAYVRLLQLYVKQSEGLVSALTGLFEQKDIDALRSQVHAIKGASGNLGMDELYVYAGKQEARLRDAQLLSAEAFERLIALVNCSLDDAQAIIHENPVVEHLERTIKNQRLFSELVAEMIDKLENSEMVPTRLQENFAYAARRELEPRDIKHIMSLLDRYDYDEALERLMSVVS